MSGIGNWQFIPSCPGYSASVYGRIRNNLTGKMLSGTDDRYGYRNVNLVVRGKAIKRKIHRLVCEAWNGPCPEGRECGHLDGVKSNNRPTNLAWVTRSENVRHQIEHGTFAGTANLVAWPTWRHKPISENVVHSIRQRASDGESGRAIARSLGLNQAHVAKIIIGKSRVASPSSQVSQSRPDGLQSLSQGEK